MTPLNHDPIGIFDSGVGGLGILKKLIERLPHENIIYYADNRNAPYGTKSLSEIRQIVDNVVRKLVGMNCKLIIVACNTATISAISHLRAGFDVPLVGVVPAVKVANGITRNGRIGIMGTRRTLEDSYVDWLSRSFAPDKQIVRLVCQEMVGAIERSESESLNQSIVQLQHRVKQADVDTVVLGCTHYTLITSELIKALPGITIVDSNDAIVRQAERLLRESGRLNDSGASPIRRLVFSDCPDALHDWVDRLEIRSHISEILHEAMIPLGESFLKDKRIHILGILGAGMSAIAQYLADRGAVVSGSDLSDSSLIEPLLHQQGIRVFHGHQPHPIDQPDWLIVSSAIREMNPELIDARQQGIPVLSRPDILSLMTRWHDTWAVCGSHGKTTITSYLASLALADRQWITALIGALVSSSSGDGNYFRSGEHRLIIEADEYDRTFLSIRASTIVVSSIDDDHKEIYPSPEDSFKAFLTFILSQNPYPRVVVNLDDPGARYILPTLRTLGISLCTVSLTDPAADCRVDGLTFHPAMMEFDLVYRDRMIPRLQHHHWGDHNLMNLLLALAALFTNDPSAIDRLNDTHELPKLFIPHRRLEILQTKPFILIDDFGHHPAEVQCTLKTALNHLPPSGRLLVFFQPHLFSRTRFFKQEFARILSMAHQTYVLDIYPSRETNPEGISSQIIIDEAHHAGYSNLHYLPSPINPSHISRILHEFGTGPDDIVMTVGAGDLLGITAMLSSINLQPV
ncbi:MAG: glutamate racemase [Candidatus Delongbacteria bacterium]|nr:glutamate racemase [Candidatus Delongbacteria bacterium]